MPFINKTIKKAFMTRSRLRNIYLKNRSDFEFKFQEIRIINLDQYWSFFSNISIIMSFFVYIFIIFRARFIDL